MMECNQKIRILEVLIHQEKRVLETESFFLAFAAYSLCLSIVRRKKKLTSILELKGSSSMLYEYSLWIGIVAKQ
jgi:hypothetical protein